MKLIAKLTLTLFLIGCATTQAAKKDDEARPKRGSIPLGNGKALSVAPSVEEMNKAFKKVAAHVAPSVVSVRTYRYFTPSGQQYLHPFHEFFFGTPPPQSNQQPEQEPQRRRVPHGGGSGFIISNNGHILTNAHVVAGADEVEVTLANKREYIAKVAGADEKTDVAVLTIQASKDELKPVSYGDSENLDVGEWVLAIGNPFGYENTVTSGIVSQKGRRTPIHPGGADHYQNFIQTDAAINPGNSGGPLVNLKGQVVGVNTLIASNSGGYQGLSFAIPVSMARKISEDLIYDGKVTRGFLGIWLQDVDADMADALGLALPNGCLVQRVEEKSPGEKGGLKAGDLVLKIEGVAMEDCYHLRNTVANLMPDEKYEFSFLRDGKSNDLEIVVGTREDDREEKGDDQKEDAKLEGAGDDFLAKKIGLRLALLTPERRKTYSLEKDVEGIVITEVLSGGSAEEKGLKPGNVITKFKRSIDKSFREVKDGKQLTEALKELATGESIALTVVSEGRKALVALKARN